MTAKRDKRAMRIVIADDSALLREGVAGLLTRRGHEVVGQVGDADALAGVVDTHRPELVITDVRMPPTMRDDGLQAALRLRETVGPVNVLVLSQYCLLYTSPSPRDRQKSRMPSSA